jgi:hypothetical protein
MKIALYIEDGLEQLVLTPESPHEKSLLESMHREDRDLRITRGSFYACRGPERNDASMFGGGYVRQSTNDDSTVVVLRKKS